MNYSRESQYAFEDIRTIHKSRYLIRSTIPLSAFVLLA